MALTTRAYTRATMAHTKRSDLARASGPHKVRRSPDWSCNRLHEVGIASNRGSECHGEYVPGPCTHPPSHHGSGVAKEVGSLTFGRGAYHFRDS